MNLLAFGKPKEFFGFLLHFAHLFVPLVLRTLGTHVQKTKRIFWISFAFHSLIRTFAGAKPRGTCSTPFNKTRI
ncbi:hypothetical protein CIK90_04940 [Prevotella sp. P5-126]|nr:hypothetical protein CIK90_04940 [Prevotella sp. P5-126]